MPLSGPALVEVKMSQSLTLFLVCFLFSGFFVTGTVLSHECVPLTDGIVGRFTMLVR